MAANLCHHYHHPLHLHLNLQPLAQFSPIKTLIFNRLSNSHIRTTLKANTHFAKRPLTVSFALTESDSTKSFNPDPQALLQELADSLDLPSDYFAKLPRDLRLDLNDAAFDLSNGPVIDECGEELGQTLLNLSRAWETADTSTSSALAKSLPVLGNTLTERTKSALGKRLVSAGRRFQSMGQYGQGELERIAKSMISVGKLLSASAAPGASEESPKNETKVLKFGDLQVELTPEKATIGAVIAVGFGILSWGVSQGIQGIPDNSLQYANENALLVAKSMRGFLLALFYTSAVLSGFSAIGLVLLAQQLKSKEK